MGQMEASKERQEEREEARNPHKLNRNRRPKLTSSEIERLETCDTPLSKEGWVEMSIDRQRGKLEVVGLSKKEQLEGEENVTIDATQTAKSRAAATESAVGSEGDCGRFVF